MFELIFGIMWIGSAFLMRSVLHSGSDAQIYVFGNLVSQEGSNPMLLFFEFIFWGFLLFGVIIICTGIKKIVSNHQTSSIGRETYGLVVDVYPSGSHVDGRPILNADVLIVDDDGVTKTFTEKIGMSWYKYQRGDYVLVKHYNNDINILDKSDIILVPQNLREKLEIEGKRMNINKTRYDRYDDFGGNYRNMDVGGTDVADTVIINGVEYVKKNKE